MTCYQRHIRWLFDSLDLEYEKANRARVDAAIREVLAVPDDAHCPGVWSAVKELSEDERETLPSRVAGVLNR